MDRAQGRPCCIHKKLTAWLEECRNAAHSPLFQPREQTADIAVAVQAWNLCGGMEWGAIELVAELLGITDLEWLVVQMAAMRDDEAKQAGSAK